MSEWVWVPFEVDKQFDGYRIDRFLAKRLKGYSRSRVRQILLDARVLREEQPAKANARVRLGQKIQVAYRRRPEKPLAQDAALPVLFEDDDLLVVNKPAGLLSHPTDKVVLNTVLGVLRHSRQDLTAVHLLHRLDRETSGVLTLAKNPRAARLWTRAMERREIHKEYLALVRGTPNPSQGVIDMPIGPEGGDIHVRQWVNVPGAATARTKYRLICSVGTVPNLKPGAPLGLSPSSMVRAFPETGRLHQIRVHFAAIGHPLLGDYLYTGTGEFYKKLLNGGLTAEDRAYLGFPRIALHAAAIEFAHPMTQKHLRVEAPLPEDMKVYLSC